MRNVYDILEERGFIKQATHEDELRKLFEKEKVTFYIGFDPTADSLHIGHFMQIIIMMHMQKAGHVPVILIGGGTAMVGDPSGRSDMRNMLTPETIQENSNKFRKFFDGFIDFSPGKAHVVNNAEWLLPLNYVDFIRDIGKHFSVNKMLQAECFKSRMEKGLSFLEFNYMLMQSYDFLVLNRKLNCQVQLGGDDQWSNIIFGADLIRREEGKQAYGLTFTLLTTSQGTKMGKTQAGALWLDPEKTSPYDFYQYWRNIDDADVVNCLKLLTFLPMEEIHELAKLEGAEINKAKEILAFEITQLVHSTEAATKAQEAAKALFSSGGNTEDMPSTPYTKADFSEGKDIVSLLVEIKLIASRSEGYRLIQQNGLSLDGKKVQDTKFLVTLDLFKDNELIIKKGKKVYHKIILK